MKLDTFTDAKASLAELMRQYHRAEIAGNDFRNLVHAFSVLLNWYKQEADLDVEHRLDELEEQLQETRTNRWGFGT